MSNNSADKQCVSAAARLQQAGLWVDGGVYLVIDIARQTLTVCRDNTILGCYPVSTSANGAGCEEDSYKTPIGIHRIAEKIGADQPPGMIFKSRIATGEVADISCQQEDSEIDLITSRILWLDGVETGINRGPGVDSRSRYIYIHGTHDEGRLGEPVSHGCVRLSNADVILLFDTVDIGTPVVIA